MTEAEKVNNEARTILCETLEALSEADRSRPEIMSAEHYADAIIRTLSHFGFAIVKRKHLMMG